MFERAAWTFAQAFLAVFVVSDLASARTAIIAGIAAALSVSRPGVTESGKHVALRASAAARRAVLAVAYSGWVACEAPSSDWKPPKAAANCKRLSVLANCVECDVPMG